jgi:hypothetical protein
VTCMDYVNTDVVGSGTLFSHSQEFSKLGSIGG